MLPMRQTYAMKSFTRSITQIYKDISVGTHINVLYTNEEGEKVFYKGYISRIDHTSSLFDPKKKMFCVSCEVYFVEDKTYEKLTLWSKDLVESLQTLDTKEDAWNICEKKKKTLINYRSFFVLLIALLMFISFLFVDKVV